ncbi:MAG: hypothetical protein JNM46_09005 [Anaerolineales bacterium]|nr:hypothetical protein [Anaerolineales bacterium]
MKSRYVPAYDLFKLVVAIILTIILIFLLLEERDRRYALLDVSAVPTVTQLVIESTATQSPLDLTSSPTQQPPTVTSTSTPAPEATATDITAPEPPPTETAVVIDPTSEPLQASNPNECPANPTRLQAGMNVKVLDWLNFRTGPGLQYEIQRTNKPGTQMEVIGGPVCTVKGENPPTAYLWWNVKMESGQEGWSAEAPLNFPNYFLEPTE